MKFLGFFVIVCFFLLLFFGNVISKKVLAQKAFSFGILFFFFLIPSIMFLTEEFNSDYYFYNFVIKRHSLNSIALTFIFLILMAILFILFSNPSKKLSNTKTFNLEKCVNISKKIICLTFFVGSTSLIIFISQFDSISTMLSYGEYSRSFMYDLSNVVDYKFSILIVPAKLILITPLLSAFVVSNNRDNMFYKFIFVISLILAVLLLLYNSSKVLILSYILYLTIPFFLKKFKHPWLLLVCCAFAFMPILGFLDNLFHYFSHGEFLKTNTSYFKYLSYFTYPFENVVNRHEILNLSGLRFGKDFITGILSVLPGLEFQSSYEPTSAFYGGINWTSGTPNDFITFSYLQFGIFGVILCLLVISKFLSFIDSFIENLPKNYGAQVFKSVLIIQTFMLVGNADFCVLVKSNFIFIVFMIIPILSAERVKRSLI